RWPCCPGTGRPDPDAIHVLDRALVLVNTGSPRWSPDSRFLAFDSRAERQAEIYVMAAEGRATRRLTNNPAKDVLPVWSRMETGSISPPTAPAPRSFGRCLLLEASRSRLRRTAGLLPPFHRT